MKYAGHRCVRLIRYDIQEAKRLVAEIARAAGVPGENAEIFADTLVESDVFGKSTHGVSRTNIYIRRILKGLIDLLQVSRLTGNGIRSSRWMPETVWDRSRPFVC
jgi:LDH2 family malate/lactate/ureidoglycolate dehydrogenase